MTNPALTPSPLVSQGLGISDEERKRRNLQLGLAQSTVGQVKDLASSPVLSRITTPDATGQTPFRRSLMQSKTSATTTAYNNALATSRLRGLQMGLQNQPIEAGNETAIEAQRAGALARIPSEVEQEAIGPEMQATGLRGSLLNAAGGQELEAAGMYNPTSYFGTAAGMESQREGELNQQYLQEQQRKGAFWRALAGMVPSLAAPFTGGLSMALSRKPQTESLSY